MLQRFTARTIEGGGADRDDANGSVGQRTLTQRYARRDAEPAAPLFEGAVVQRRSESPVLICHDDVHAAAAAGVASPGSGLPHGDAVRASFGRHAAALDGVTAHTDAGAGDAARAIGADAYTTGGRIAFATPSPSLALVGHEAAHVVQQKRGVSLSGGVGAAGDAFEVHADRVGDAVARGDNAEAILDEMAGAGGGGASVQRKAKKDDEEARDRDAGIAMPLAVDILDGRRPNLSGAPARFLGALQLLAAAKSGAGPAVERKKALEMAIAGLRDAVVEYRHNGSQEDYVQENYAEPIALLRESLEQVEVNEKLASAVALPGGAVLVPGQTPKEQAGQLRAALKVAVPAMKTINEQALSLGEKELEHESEKLYEHGHTDVPSGIGRLRDLQSGLVALDGFLLLTDDEASTAEKVKGAIEATTGTLATASVIAAKLAEHYGQPGMAARLLGGTRLLMGGKALGGIMAGVEIVSGAVQVFTGKTTFDKVDGAMTMVGGGLSIAGLAGVEAAGPAGFALGVAWMEFKLFLGGVGETGTAITSAWMQKAFSRLAQDGREIADAGIALAKSAGTRAVEKDAHQAALLDEHVRNDAQQLGEQVDSLIGDLQIHVKRDADFVSDPGQYGVLRDAFAPIMGLGGRRDPDGAARAAAAVLERLKWVFDRQDDLIQGGAFGLSVKEIERREDEAKKDAD